MTTKTDKGTKGQRIVFWIFTSIIFLMDGVVPIIFMNSPLAIKGIHDMGFPEFFRIELSLGKGLGGLLLILPFVPARFKEWAYVGFGISLISAFIGNAVLHHPIGDVISALVGFIILLISYIFYHKTYGKGTFSK